MDTNLKISTFFLLFTAAPPYIYVQNVSDVCGITYYLEKELVKTVYIPPCCLAVS